MEKLANFEVVRLKKSVAFFVLNYISGSACKN